MTDHLLGYSGMMSLGYSYTLGQAILHQEIAPSPSDPGLPNDLDLLDVLDAANGQIVPPRVWPMIGNPNTLPAVLQNADANRSTWTQEQISAAQDYARTCPSVRGLFAAFKSNGPIPTDAESTKLSDTWGSADQIHKERHVYFYARQGDVMGGASGLDDTAALYCQIQGDSYSTNSWVVPRVAGTQVYFWRYDGPMGGPLRTGGNQWKATVGAWDWVSAHGETVTIAAVAVAMAIFTVFTAGVGAAVAVPAMAAVISGFGIAAGAAATALAGTVWAAVSGLAGKCIVAAFTGDSSGILPAALNAGAALGQVGEAAVQKMAEDPNVGPGMSAVKDVAQTLEKLKTSVQGSIDEIGPWLAAAETQAKSIAPVDWRATLKMVGGVDENGRLTGNVGSFFMNQVRQAASSVEIEAMHAAAPWYAKGFTQVAGTMRAVELVQQRPDPRALAQGLHTGLYSARYLASLVSTKVETRPVSSAPVLTRVTAPMSKAKDAGSLSNIAPPPAVVASSRMRTAEIAVPAALALSVAARFALPKYFWWVAGAATLSAGAAVALSGRAQSPKLIPPGAP